MYDVTPEFLGISKKYNKRLWGCFKYCLGDPAYVEYVTLWGTYNSLSIKKVINFCTLDKNLKIKKQEYKETYEDKLLSYVKKELESYAILSKLKYEYE